MHFLRLFLFTICWSLFAADASAAPPEDDLNGADPCAHLVSSGHDAPNVVVLSQWKLNKIPSLAENDNVPGKTKYQKIAEDISGLIDTYKGLVQVGPSEFLHLSQNDVWILHGRYVQLSQVIDFLCNLQTSTNDPVFIHLRANFSELTRLIEETQFFGKLERNGYTLVPSSEQIIKTPLPQEYKATLVVMTFHLQMVRIGVGLLQSLDGIYSDSFRRRLINGSQRQEVFESLIGYFEQLLPILRKMRSEVEMVTTDISQAVEIVEETQSLLKLPAITRAVSFGRQSPYTKTRALVARFEDHVAQFNILAHLIRNPGRPLLRDAQSEKPILGITDSDVKKLRTAISAAFDSREVILGDSQGVALWQPALSELTVKIEAVQDLHLTSQGRQELEILVNWAANIVQKLPTNLSWFDSNTADDINAGNRVRKDLQKLKSLLGLVP